MEGEDTKDLFTYFYFPYFIKESYVLLVYYLMNLVNSKD